ncbi:MAG: molybdenum cofactor guanylyltransferase [bacterium]|nr:molybdenum cofactor guanylyltransferase [bacterium]
MKRNKALLEVSGVRLIEKVGQNLEPYFKEIIVSAQSKEAYDFLPYRVVTDDVPDQGPLMGIMCGLKASSTAVNFVIACDIPEVNMEFVFEMMKYTGEYEMVVPVSEGGKFEPLFAFYNKSVVAYIEAMLAEGNRKAGNLILKGKVKKVPMEDNRWYYNLNTADEYKEYLKKQ